MAVFGPQGVVIRVNLALGNPVPTGVAFTNQVAAATANENLYLTQITQPFVGLSNAAYSAKVLTGLGVTPPTVNQASYDALLQALVDYLAYVGVANRGIVTRQLGELLSGLTADATFGLAAQQFNTATDTAFASNNPPDPIGNTTALTSALNLFSTKAGDTVVGDEQTLTTGDKIVGPGAVELVLTNAGIIGSNTTITGASKVSISSSGSSDITTKNWTGLGSLELTKITGNLTVRDLQSAVPPVVIDDAIDAASTITLNFDAQAVVGATTVAIGLKEVNSAVALTGGPIETVTLTDNGTANFANNLTSLAVSGINTLNITGGVAGNTFGIVGALDAGLTTINAATARANLSLNVANSTKNLAVTLGTGNDFIGFGDTLGTGDTVNGGAGADTVGVVFTSAGLRTPTLSNVETLDATFNGAASFDGSLTDGLNTAILRASSQRADFLGMDADFSKIVVAGNAARGIEVDFSDNENAITDLTVEITGTTSLIGGGGGPNDGQPGIRAINARTLDVVHNGTSNVLVSPGIQVANDANATIETIGIRITNNSSGSQFGDDDGNLSIALFNDSTIKDGNSVRDLEIRSTGSGDIRLGAVSDPTLLAALLATLEGVSPGAAVAILNENGITAPAAIAAILSGNGNLDPVTFSSVETAAGSAIESLVALTGLTLPLPLLGALMDDANVLQNFTISAADDSDITAGIVGGLSIVGLVNGVIDPFNLQIDNLIPSLVGDAANNLKVINISAGISSTVRQYGIDADDAIGGSNTGSFINTINITGKNSSNIFLGGDGLLATALGGAEVQNQGTVNEAAIFPLSFNWLEANRVGNMTISSNGQTVAGGVNIVLPGIVPNVDADADGVLDTGLVKNLIGLNLDSTGGTLTVSGSANVSGFYFTDESFSTINASAHTNNATDFTIDLSSDMFLGAGLAALTTAVRGFSFFVGHTEETTGATTFLGSSGRDMINGGSGNDNFSGNNGDDVLVGGEGADTLLGGAGNDILRGGDLGGGFNAAASAVLTQVDPGLPGGLGGVPRDTTDANDLLDGGAGNDILIGDRNAASLSFGDTLTGGAGNDLFYFNLFAGRTGALADTGKSTNTIKADVITDFASGQDTIVIDVTAPTANFSIVEYNSNGAAIGSIGVAANPVLISVRRGTYNQDTGQFAANATGNDYQVLINNDGAQFSANVAGAVSGGAAFADAEHEIALLGAAANNGSLNITDFAFV